VRKEEEEEGTFGPNEHQNKKDFDFIKRKTWQNNTSNNDNTAMRGIEGMG